jgi:hypothetical protein
MTRADSAEKDRILESAGFFYDFNKDIYLNRESKKVFSVEAITDNPVEWLRTRIMERNDTEDWIFYFNQPPDPDVRQEIIEGIR